MAGEQDLKLRAKLEGGEQTARGVEKIAGAEKKLGDQTKRTGDAAEDAARDAKTLTAAEGDYFDVLRRINPVLGDYADGLFKGTRVLGEFATQEISLGDVVQTVSTAIAAQANTLKLLGAAAGVGVGFLAIAKAMSVVREESEKLRAELKALRNEQTEEVAEALAMAKEITVGSAERAEGKFTAEEEAEAEYLAERLLRRRKAEDTELLKKNIRALAGLMTSGEIEKLAMAGVAIPIEAPREAREAIGRAALEREGVAERIEREQKRVAEKRARDATAAREELLSETGPKAHAEAFLDEFTKGFSKASREAVEKMIRQVLEQIEDLPKARAAAEKLDIPFLGFDLERNLNVARQSLESLFAAFTGGEFGTAVEAEQALKGLRELLGFSKGEEDKPENLARSFQEATAAQKENTEAMKKLTAELRAGGGKTEIGPHARIVYPDAAAVKRNTVNGESDRERRKVG